MTTKYQLLCMGETSIGAVRKKNEDNFCLVNFPLGELRFAVVADGIGGHRNGELASYICCRDLFYDFLAQMPNISNSEDSEKFYKAEVRKINQKIFTRNTEEMGGNPMGTTLVSAIFGPDFVSFVNVGDSRLYEITGDQLKQITTDHCLKNHPEIANVFNSMGLNNNPDNVICRAIGTKSNVIPQIETIERRFDSRYVLVTDGVYRAIDDKGILNCVKNADTPRQAINNIMRAGFIANASDNLTAVVAFNTPWEE